MLYLLIAIGWFVLSLACVVYRLTARSNRGWSFGAALTSGLAGEETAGQLDKYWWVGDLYLLALFFTVGITVGYKRWDNRRKP